MAGNPQRESHSTRDMTDCVSVKAIQHQGQMHGMVDIVRFRYSCFILTGKIGKCQSVKAIQHQGQVQGTVHIVWLKYSGVILTMKNVLYNVM